MSIEQVFLLIVKAGPLKLVSFGGYSISVMVHHRTSQNTMSGNIKLNSSVSNRKMDSVCSIVTLVLWHCSKFYASTGL